MNTNFAKIIAIAVVGSVAKALFTTPRPITNNHYHTDAPAKDLETTKADV